MGFLNNSTITVDAILTKKGRELLARGNNEFKITKFALSDDDIDYTLWDVSHPNGTNYYGTVIENMPVLEAFPDETQIMRYKLITLPKATTRMPILQVPVSSMVFNGPGDQPITPLTLNASDATLGYTFILHNGNVAYLRVGAGGSVPNSGNTIPVFLDTDELTNSQAVSATTVQVYSKQVNSTQVTQLTIVGNETGATATIPITVKPGPTAPASAG